MSEEWDKVLVPLSAFPIQSQRYNRLLRGNFCGRWPSSGLLERHRPIALLPRTFPNQQHRLVPVEFCIALRRGRGGMKTQMCQILSEKYSYYVVYDSKVEYLF